jgi:hypothetical protein
MATIIIVIIIIIIIVIIIIIIIMIIINEVVVVEALCSGPAAAARPPRAPACAAAGGRSPPGGRRRLYAPFEFPMLYWCAPRRAQRAPAQPQRHARRAERFRPPPPRTKWTRRVPHPVLIGHAASLTPY